MAPHTREQALLIDRYLYSRRGAPLWAALVAAAFALAVFLHGQRLSWGAALFLGVGGVACLGTFVLTGWLTPEKFSGPRLWRITGVALLASYAGGLTSIFATVSLSGIPLAEWPAQLLAAVWRATPFLLLAGLGMVLLMWATSASRRRQLQRELSQLRLHQEAQATAAQLTQARLRLLQAQIQPHFLFNTLAALQHWVDESDPRAALLLRSLTAFLRSATEQMLQPSVALAQEAAMARHYLDIMQARLGERLRFRIEVPADCAAQPLPPGLLVTLVENAVAHGIEPQLRGGEVQVRARRSEAGFELCVLDSGAGLPAGGPTDGVGLANSRERLRHAFGDRARLEINTRGDGPGTEVKLTVVPDATP